MHANYTVMEHELLSNINSPDDLKLLPIDKLPQLCNELRQFIIENLSHNPGHLASSLGTIELTVALHYVYNTPKDRLLWDVGHQAYAHKILTGRRERFHTNRQFKGLAPFPSPFESEYDAFIAGHASNSISAALGEQLANQLKKDDRQVVAIIGDGAMTGGLAFEGLNNTSMRNNNLLIILNDNNMAIDPIKGGFTQYLLDITTSAGYNKWRYRMYQMAKWLHLIDDNKKQNVQRFNNSLKAILTKQSKNIFTGLNLRYFGPADGHNVIDLVHILSEIKNYKGPRVLHIITKKGKGYKPAEENQTLWHAPGEFNIESGERKMSDSHELPSLWQEVFGNTLTNIADDDERVVGITPAMLGGCSMNIMQKKYPDRVFDVGIAEGHAVTFAAGLAKEGMIPYCNIYSSFLQRAYDNIIHDVALQKLHVVLCIDRAGIVGADGATHHGLFDLAYLRPIPNIIVSAPSDADDLANLLHFAHKYDGPIAIRYPRGRTPIVNRNNHGVNLGKGKLIKEGKRIVVLAIGSITNTIMSALCDTDYAVYDMIWLKPIDTEILDFAAKNYDIIITAEDGIIAGGFGSAVSEYITDKGYSVKVKHIGINDQFVEHGSTAELYKMLGLDAEGIKKTINEISCTL